LTAQLFRKIEQIYALSTGKSLKIIPYGGTVEETGVTFPDSELNHFDVEWGNFKVSCISEQPILQTDKTLLESLWDLVKIPCDESQTKHELETYLEAIENSNPLFLAVNHEGKIIKNGNLWRKTDQKSFEGLPFDSVFDFQYESPNALDVLESYFLSSKIFFIQPKGTPRKFKASIQKKENTYILLVQPVVNSQHSLSDFKLDLKDFLPHEYVAEFVFLQNSSTKSLDESRKLLEKIKSRNNEIESLSRFPSENPNPILRFSISGEILYMNECAKENFSHLMNEADPLFVEIINKTIQERNTDGRIEKDDKIFLYSARNLHLDGYVNVYLFDFTTFNKEINDLYETISTQHDFYEQILNEIPNDIAVFDKNHKYLFVNPQGIRNEEIRKFMIGKDDFDYCNFKGISDEIAVQRRAIFNKIVETGLTLEWEDHHITSEGKSLHVLRKMTPVFGSNKEVIMIIGYGVDITKRIEVEKRLLKLNEENTLLRKFIDKTKDAIQVVDDSGKIVYLNEEAINRLGFNSFDYIDHYLGEFEPMFQDNTQWDEHFNQLRDVGSMNMVSFNTNIKTGELIDVDLNINLENINGTEYVIAVSRDITEKKKVEIELERKREFQEILIETARRYINIKGSNISEAINDSLSFIGEFTDVDRVYIFNYDHINEVSSNSFEWCAVDIKPEIENLQGIPFEYIPDWTNTHFQGDEMHIENVMQLEEGPLRAILEPQGIKSLLAIPMFSGESCIGFVGFDAVKSLKVFSSEERNLLRLFAEMLVNMFERAKYVEEIEHSRAEIVKYNENLEFLVQDETRKNLELSTLLTNQDKLATIGEIAAGIAHDLNTPLGSVNIGIESVDYIVEKVFENFMVRLKLEEIHEIYNFAKTRSLDLYQSSSKARKEMESISSELRSTYSLNNETSSQLSRLFVQCQIGVDEKDSINKMISLSDSSAGLELLYSFMSLFNLINSSKISIQRASDVVRNLRTFMKGSGSVNASFAPTNLDQTLKTVLSVFNHDIRKKIILNYAVDNALEINADEIKLFQLWSNLIKNAIEAMDEQQNRILSIYSVDEKNTIKICIANNGEMISEEIKAQIFNKFFTTKHHKSGTGLGLSIVSSIISDHNAEIQLESTQEQTTFSVIFKKTNSNG
jgi:PAS domain S-box-containing protein